MLDWLIGLFSSYYFWIAVLLYGIFYIYEVVLDLPTWGKPDVTEVPHGELKDIIQKVFEEIIKLPDFLDNSGVPSRPPPERLEYFDPKKYEQLVATAVINKLAEFYQNDKNLPENSSGVHSDMEFDSNHNQLNGKDQLNSLEAERIQSYKLQARKSSDTDESLLSDYLQSHSVPLPDFSHDSANDEEIQSTRSNGTDSTWEENWIFKKRKLKTDTQAPIAMLVPQPTEEVKALIGDKNADETSDLSENSDVEMETDRRKKKKSKNLLSSFSKPATIDETLAPASLISTQSFTSNSENSPNVAITITEAKNDRLLCEGNAKVTTKPEKPLIEIQTSENKTLVMNTLIGKNEINFIIDDVMLEKSSKSGSRDDLNKSSELDFIIDHIVSPHSVREHKKSIDEQFETLLKDDNNNKITAENVNSSSNNKKEIEDNKCNIILEQLTSSNVDVEVVEDKLPIPAPRNTTPTPVSAEEVVKPKFLTKTVTERIETILEKVPAAEKVALKKQNGSMHVNNFEQTARSTPVTLIARNNNNIKPVEKVPIKKPIKVTCIVPVKERIQFIENNPVKSKISVEKVSVPAPKSATHVEKVPIVPVVEEQKSTIEDKVPEIKKTEISINITAPKADDKPTVKTPPAVPKKPDQNKDLSIDPEEVLMESIKPGSIAEREHLKWLKAAPIANNPYSAEALQKRLSESDHKNKIMDINNQVIDALVEESKAHESEDELEERITKPITKQVNYEKYGRDYYINDSRYQGAKKRSPSSPLSSKSSSVEHEDNKKPEKLLETAESGVFRAHPIVLDEPDSVLKKVNKFNQLSKSEQDLHLLPLNRTQKLNVSTSSLLSNSSIPVSPRTNDDSSFTFSEDSDTTRIYDFRTRETKLVIPETPEKEIDLKPSQLSPLKRVESIEVPIEPKKVLRPVKPLSPETIEFFSPKKSSSLQPSPKRKMEVEQNNHVEPHLTNGDVHDNSEEVEVIEEPKEIIKVEVHEKVDIQPEPHDEKVVIEKDVAEVLPSVKKLAKIYASNDSHSSENGNVPLMRPKSFAGNPEQHEDVNVTNVVKPSQDSYVPHYGVYHPVAKSEHKAILVGHSITARSIPAKMRDELKRTYSNEERVIVRRSSPERPSSPTLQPGLTRNSIQFFENLKK